MVSARTALTFWLFSWGSANDIKLHYPWAGSRDRTDPPVSSTSFGNRESDDLKAALDFLRGLKSDSQSQLVGDRFGLYGVELGAYVAMHTANQEASVRALVLDSVPPNSDELVRTAVIEEVGLNNRPLQALTRAAARVYFLGQYENKSSCDLAAGVKTQRVLLLAGADTGSPQITNHCKEFQNQACRGKDRSSLMVVHFLGYRERESYDRP